MFEIRITIAAPELAGAIEKLADAVAVQPQAKKSKKEKTQSESTAPAQVVAQPVQTIPTPYQPAAPTQVDTQPVQTAPPQYPPAATPAPTMAPTAEVQYNIGMLQKAASSLMDAGRGAELGSLLAQFGVQALTMLPKEQYGAFATALRSLGAQI